MQITQELIDRFFRSECSSEEVGIVIKYLSNNTAAFEQYMGKRDWDQTDSEACLDTVQSNLLLASLKKQLFQQQKIFSIGNGLGFRMLVTAASVILLLISGWWFIRTTHSPKQPVAIKNEKTAVEPAGENRNWQVVKNTSKENLMVTLEDGSVITLFKHSVIQYPKPFSPRERIIELDGDAIFKVAKNKQKPFTVFAGDLSTTALGTSFRITAFDDGKSMVKVKLLTGKVVVKSTRAKARWKKYRFLLPGDLLTYHTHTNAVLMSRFLTEKEATASIPGKPEKKLAARELKFNTTALHEVLGALAVMHHIEISHNAIDIKGMNFTGTINEYDDVQAVLKIIAQMNELQVKQTSKGFDITSLQKK